MLNYNVTDNKYTLPCLPLIFNRTFFGYFFSLLWPTKVVVDDWFWLAVGPFVKKNCLKVLWREIDILLNLLKMLRSFWSWLEDLWHFCTCFYLKSYSLNFLKMFFLLKLHYWHKHTCVLKVLFIYLLFIWFS